MKNLITLTIIAAIGLPLSGFAAAEKKPAAAQAPAAEAKKPDAPAAKPDAAATKPFPYHGDVAAVDATAKTFTFKNKDGKERLFSVTDKTEIEKDGAKADFAAITVGAYAAGQCNKSGEGKFEAVSVKIGPKPAKKAKDAAAKPADAKPADAKPAEKK